MTWSDDRFPADPYPGCVPPGSFVHVDGVAHALPPDLDRWLAAHDAPPAAERVPVLAYGSNRCPSKLTWLRATSGLTGAVVVLRARTEGIAAVWAHGMRARDGQRPAVLAAAPGSVEEHAILLVTREQVAALDACEGRAPGGDGRYRLARLHTGTVRTEDGARVVDPWCYLGQAPARRPLLVDGAPVRCADTGSAAAAALHGPPAAGDGLDASTVHGSPHPDEWPSALFVYGLLQPGQPSWPLVAPHAVGPSRRLVAVGTVYDTGRGYPALRPGPGSGAPGWVVPLGDPATLLPVLDDYEGPDYRRIRLRLPDDTVSWAYAWAAPPHGLSPLPSGWPVSSFG